MKLDWPQVLANAIPGVIAAVVSSALTARWALSRFRSEKWWERKASTYADILRALFLVKRYIDNWIENNEEGGGHTSEYKQRLLDDWHVGARAVEEATAIGSFLVSPKAAEILTTLQREKWDADPSDPSDQAYKEAAALSKAIPIFVEEAKRDLGIPVGAKSTSLRKTT
jgi:hypothetical protein